MSSHSAIAQHLQQSRKGHTLPRELYVSEEAFKFDTQVMLPSVWLYACTVAHVKKPGDYFIFELAQNSIIIVRGRDNAVRAFWNSCRHRGAKLCLEQKGSAPRLMCPFCDVGRPARHYLPRPRLGAQPNRHRQRPPAVGLATTLPRRCTQSRRQCGRDKSLGSLAL